MQESLERLRALRDQLKNTSFLNWDEVDIWGKKALPTIAKNWPEHLDEFKSLLKKPIYLGELRFGVRHPHPNDPRYLLFPERSLGAVGKLIEYERRNKQQRESEVDYRQNCENAHKKVLAFLDGIIHETKNSISMPAIVDQMNENSFKKILILAANPKNSTPLRLDQEVRDIDEGLRRAKQRDRFALTQKWAVRPRDVQRAILDLNPQIVHFSGHGVDEGGLALEDETGQAKLVSTQAIAGLFELFADQIECVLLNACYSEVQAEAIAHHIPYVIGMSKDVGDTAAIEFAVGFYDALGAGKSIEFAYKFGCSSIRMAGIPEDMVPVLKRRSDLALPVVEHGVDAQIPSEVAPAPLILDEPEGQVPIDLNESSLITQ